MRQNLTTRLERDIIEKARVLAARRSTSSSRPVAAQIERLVAEGDRCEQVKREAIEELTRG